MVNNQFSSFLKNWINSIFFEQKKLWKWSRKNQINTLKQMSLLMKNNVYLNDIATIFIDFGSNKEKEIGKKISEVSTEGYGLDKALKDDLSQSAYESLSAGIYSDNPIPGIDNAVNSLELKQSMTGSLMWEFIKPMIGVVIGVAALVGYSKFFVPKILPMLPLNRFPWIGVFVNDMGLFFGEFGVTIFTVILVLLVGVLISLPIFTGKHRAMVDNSIIYRQYRILVSTSALQSLSNLKRSKVSLVDSLKKIRDTSPPYVAGHFEKMIDNLGEGASGKDGDNLGVIMDTGLLLEDQVQLLKMLGSKTDHGTVLQSSADIHQNKLETEISIIKHIGNSTLKIIGFALVSSILAAVALVVIEVAININIG